MSTNDVPGNNPANRDELSMGCWAEHSDKSLIFVEGNEGGRTIFSVFDLSKEPPVEYRDAMPEASFKRTFSWPTASGDKWTWHDKTPFPWDRVIKNFNDGPRPPSAAHYMSAAERVAESLRMRGQEIDRENDPRFSEDRVVDRVSAGIMDRLWRAMATMAPDDEPEPPQRRARPARSRSGRRPQR